MRLAVESLNYPGRLGCKPVHSRTKPVLGAGPSCGEEDSGRGSSRDEDRGQGGGYYPGKFTERMERQEAASPASSTVSSPTYPFSVSGRSSPTQLSHSPQLPQLSHSETYIQVESDKMAYLSYNSTNK